jgi:3-deoxy-manno-octulosonate cytidylyltransferase (CMP-KDO synthetase)
MKTVIVIPARMKSSRLPGKPLIKINGITILERVYSKCKKVLSEDKIFVATESKEIVEFCKKKNFNCVNTGKANTALDRIGQFSYKVNADIYINVQGDEPIINVNDIKKIINFSSKYKNAVLFGKAPCDKKTFFDYSKAKVTVDENSKVLYTGRSGIPLSSKGKFAGAYKAIWIYSLPKKLIRKYLSHGYGKLEFLEGNEVLRFLEMNIDTYAINLKGNSWAVDLPKDVEIVKKMLTKK